MKRLMPGDLVWDILHKTYAIVVGRRNVDMGRGVRSFDFLDVLFLDDMRVASCSAPADGGDRFKLISGAT